MLHVEADADAPALAGGMNMARYRFDMIGAQLAGERRHPQTVILEWFPDAAELEPAPIADAWFFTASSIPDRTLPAYFRALPGHK